MTKQALLVPQAKNEIDMSGSFSEFWTTLVKAGNLGPIEKLLAIVGMFLVAWALAKWAWDKRRGMGGGMGGGGNAVMGALLIGAILSAPSVLMPILLTFMDVIINGALSVWNSASKGA